MHNIIDNHPGSSSFLSLCHSLISNLALYLLKSLKNEFFELRTFSSTIISTYKKLAELEFNQHVPKTSHLIQDLARYCNKTFLFTSSSKKVRFKPNHFQRNSSITPNPLNIEDKGYFRLGHRRVVNSYNKGSKKTSKYYNGMMGRYLEISLNNEGTGIGHFISKSNGSQVQLKDGMFYRLL